MVWSEGAFRSNYTLGFDPIELLHAPFSELDSFAQTQAAEWPPWFVCVRQCGPRATPAVSNGVSEAPRLELMEQDSKDSAQSSITSSSSETQPEYNVSLNHNIISSINLNHFVKFWKAWCTWSVQFIACLWPLMTSSLIITYYKPTLLPLWH